MIRVLCFIILNLHVILVLASNRTIVNYGRLCPEMFGAKADGHHDDTRAIQTALDSLDQIGGGLVYLNSGTYMVSSLKLGKKTSITGCGNGATILKQINGSKEGCIIVPAYSAALRIASLSIIGNDVNKGIIIEEANGKSENHPYLYNKEISNNVLQPYKWITIDDICIYHFGTGLEIDKPGYNINICNSTFSYNDIGVDMKCSDSSLYNCYITNNRLDGLLLTGSNNKISNVKSIFNGLRSPKESSAISIKGLRNQFVNCETQDNYCKGYYVAGSYNLMSNCISNTDGYAKEPKSYDPSIKACGFMINGLYNSFSNCAVTNYNEKYGAVYYSPIIINKNISYYYSNIYDDIKVLIAKDKLMFHEPFHNVQTLTSKNKIKNPKIVLEGGEYYFKTSDNNSNIIENINCPICNLNILADVKGENGQIINIGDGEHNLRLFFTNGKIVISLNDKQIMELPLDKEVNLNADISRLIVSFSQYNHVIYAQMIYYEKTIARGWIKKELRQEVDINAYNILKGKVNIGGKGLSIKRLALCETPLPESVFLPYSNTNEIYNFSYLYIDADSIL